MCTLSSLSCPHSRHSCRSVCPVLYRWALSVVWPVNSPTAALTLYRLIANSSLALPARRYLISILDCRQPVQAVHLADACSSKYFLMSFFCTLIDPQIVKKFLALYVPKGSFTTARNLSLSWARSIHSVPPPSQFSKTHFFSQALKWHKKHIEKSKERRRDSCKKASIQGKWR